MLQNGGEKELAMACPVVIRGGVWVREAGTNGMRVEVNKCTTQQAGALSTEGRRDALLLMMQSGGGRS